MTLSKEQLSKLIKTYANDIADNMDVRDLCAFVINAICDDMNKMTEENILKEIEFYYEEDGLNDLIKSMTAK